MEHDMSKNLTVLTLGGRVQCRQCQAKAKHSRVQCKKAAMRNKNVCRTHGGASTGPRTEQGRQRCAAAKTIHGNQTRENRKQNAASMTKLLLLRDLGIKLGMFGSKPTGWAGRPPNLYYAANKNSLITRCCLQRSQSKRSQKLVRALLNHFISFGAFKAAT
jgi:hypothetical protein